MQKFYSENLLPVKYGLLLALFTLVYGFGLGAVFGAFEEDLKDRLKSDATEVLATVYNGDEAKVKTILDKSWVYFKRAHLHANGLGTASVVLIILLTFFPVSNRIKSINAIFLGLGSFGYALFWMIAGFRAPAMGSTGLAKESLAWLALPSSSLCIIGLLMIVVLVIVFLFVKFEKQTS
ncbi:MAG: hypothetical protein P8X73_01030 [Ignavibacteriaceae bacterium]|jgi:hypothetical protein